MTGFYDETPGTCTSCLDFDNNCTTCTYNSNVQCQTCSNNFNPATNCSDCITGSYLNGLVCKMCSDTIPNCAECKDTGGLTCTKCKDGFDIGNNCATCLTGKYLNVANNICVDCSDLNNRCN